VPGAARSSERSPEPPGAAALAGVAANGHDGAAARGAGATEQVRWKTLVDALQRASASRFFRLSYSKVVEIGDSTISIAVTGKEAISALTAPEVKATIEDAIEREFGRRLAFEPVVPGDGSVPSATSNHATLDRQGREDPAVQLSVEILEGRVEGVLPRSRRET